MVANRRSNGDGSFHVDERGRWVARSYVTREDGGRKRIKVYGATRAEARSKLMDRLTDDRHGFRSRNRSWTVGEYLDYWFEAVVRKTRKERTQEFYESAIRLYLRPTLGAFDLSKLGIQDVQRAFNTILDGGTGVRTVQKLHQTLRAALTQAEREELVLRNVARLVVLPRYTKKPIVPWTLDEQRRFLTAAAGHRWFAGYAMLLFYGLRRGEVLGLRRSDVDLDRGLIRVRRQLQRIKGKGLTTGTVKTSAGERVLPITPPARQALLSVPSVGESDGPLLTSQTGTAVDPKNFVRAFHMIREKAELPFVTVHQLRHAAATNMKDHGVAATDAQAILGHAHVSTTMQIYTHSNIDAQRSGLARIHEDLGNSLGPQTGVPEPTADGVSPVVSGIAS